MHALLQGIPIFAGLSDRAIDLLLEHAEIIDFPAGAPIVREGENGNRMFVIAHGSVGIFKNFGLANQVELATLGPKDFFGEMCILDPMPRAATVQATTPATVVSVSSASFHHLYQKMPEQYSVLLLNIARDLSRRIRHLDEVFAGKH